MCGQLVARCVKLKGQVVTCDVLVMCRIDRYPAVLGALWSLTYLALALLPYFTNIT